MILDIYKDSLEYAAKDWKTLLILGVLCEILVIRVIKQNFIDKIIKKSKNS